MLKLTLRRRVLTSKKICIGWVGKLYVGWWAYLTTSLKQLSVSTRRNTQTQDTFEFQANKIFNTPLENMALFNRIPNNFQLTEQ